MTLPDGWQQVPLGDLVDVLDSRRVPVSAAERAKRPGRVPYYGAAGPVGSIDEALFDEPLVLLGEDGVQFFDPHKAKAYAIQGPAWVNNHAHVLRARPAVDRRFLLHFLNVFDYRDYANGTTRLKLTQAAMRAIPVPLPSPGEQRRIVDLLEEHLSRLDVARSQVRSSADRLLQLRLGQLRRWRTESLAASPDGPRALGEVAETSLGKMLDARRSSGETTAYLRNINVRWGRIDTSDVFTVPLSNEERAKFSLRQGDLLVCEGGEPGRAAIWESDQPMTFQKALHRVRVREGADVLVPFLQLMLEEFVRTGRAADMFTGTTIKHLPQEKLRQIRIPLPPAHLQARVLAEAEAAESASARLDDELRQVEVRSQALRRSLLAVAFTGQLTRTAPVSEGRHV